MKTYLVGMLLAAFVAMPALAYGGSSSDSSSTDLSCMQSAVEKRDNAIIDAWDDLHDDMTAALTERRDDLKSAWGLSDKKERRAAIKAAWKAFKAARKDAHKAFGAARKDAWKTFKTDAKACKGSGEETESESADAL